MMNEINQTLASLSLQSNRSLPEIRSSEDIVSLMLKWDPKWMLEPDSYKNPGILKNCRYKVQKLPEEFESHDEYKERFLPLILDDLWASICAEYEEKKSSGKDRIDGCRLNSIQKPVSYLTWSHRTEELEEYDLAVQSNTFVLIQFFDKIKRSLVSKFGFVEKVTENETFMNHRIRVNRITADNIINFGLESEKSPPVCIHFLSQIKSDLCKANAVIDLHSFKLGPSILNPTTELLTLPLVAGSDLHPDLRENNHLSNLNSLQKEIVVGIDKVCEVDDKKRIGLVQGPPGTGKSTTISGIVCQIYSNCSRTDADRPRMIVCAPSNAAVDAITLKLMTLQCHKLGISILRFGRPEKINPQVNDVTFEVMSDQKVKDIEAKNKKLTEEANKIRAQINLLERVRHEPSIAEQNKIDALIAKQSDILAKKKNITKELKSFQGSLLSKVDVILTTLCFSGNFKMDKYFGGARRKISICIIDEAGQCVEPEALIPLKFNMSKLIMVGDHKQLPPTIISINAKKQGYDRSLFKRLFTRPQHKSGIMLTTQYRMHPEILAWPNKHFYSGNILQGVTHADLNLVPYRIIDSKSKQMTRHPDICNPREVDLTKDIITEIKVAVGDTLSIGLITFYKWQKQKLQEMVKKGFKNVDVDTVDGFQGSERDIIIISCVRSGDSIGFLKEAERLNVALTRAKRSLFILCNPRTMQTNPMWDELIKDAKTRGTID